jgi:hypothetical protein
MRRHAEGRRGFQRVLIGRLSATVVVAVLPGTLVSPSAPDSPADSRLAVRDDGVAVAFAAVRLGADVGLRLAGAAVADVP